MKKIAIFGRDKSTSIYRWLVVLLWVAGFFALVSSFSSNTFHIVDNNWFSGWQSDSEWCVWQRIYDDVEMGFRYNYGLLGGTGENTGIYDPNHEVYTAQTGLQGFAYGVLYRVFPNVTDHVCYIITSILLALCIFAILYWIKQEFSGIVSVVLYLSVLFNQWLTASARNMYWVIWTFFLPFVITLYFLWNEEKKGKCNIKLLYIFSFFSIFIRCSCGYEFLSVVMINLEIPLFYYAYKNKWKIKEFIKRFLSLAAVAILAFICSLICCMTQVYMFSGRNWNAAIQAIAGRVGTRTGAFANILDFSGVTRVSQEISKVDILNEYFNNGTPLIFNIRMNVIIVIIVVGMLMTLFTGKISPTIEKNRRKLLAFDIMTVVTFLSPLSWYILATAHSYIHLHICYILWSMPFIIIGLALPITTICLFAMDNIKKLFIEEVFSKTAKKISICVGIVCGLIVVGLYVNMGRAGSELIKEIPDYGKLIYNENGNKIYYFDSALYYVVDKENINEKFFLHLYPENATEVPEEGFYGRDFLFEEHALREVFWKKERLAIVEIPSDIEYNKIETGQYNDEKRFWETSFSLKKYVTIPQSITVLDLSDENWDHGFNKWNNSFLVNSEDISLWSIKGSTVRIGESGESTKITNIEKVDENYILYTKDHLSSDSANTELKIIE